MMILRVSTKLGKKIRVSPESCLPLHENPFADWSAHLFTADRTQYILVTNTASLYSMVMYGKGIADDSIFLQRAVGLIGEVLRDDDQGSVFERLIVPSTAQVRFSKALNRAVTGSMNDLVFQAKVHLIRQEISPYDTSFRLNEVPMSYLKYASPRQAFANLKPQESDGSLADS